MCLLKHRNAAPTSHLLLPFYPRSTLQKNFEPATADKARSWNDCHCSHFPPHLKSRGKTKCGAAAAGGGDLSVRRDFFFPDPHQEKDLLYFKVAVFTGVQIILIILQMVALLDQCVN